jgi:hypothetical protein
VFHGRKSRNQPTFHVAGSPSHDHVLTVDAGLHRGEWITAPSIEVSGWDDIGVAIDE